MNMSDMNWRQPMWADLMTRLPSSITINMNTQSYLVKDNSLQCIYADDIDEAGVNVLIDELARELPSACRDEFRKNFSMKALKKNWSEGKDIYTRLSTVGTGEMFTLKTDVIFNHNSKHMVFELRFDV